MSPSTRTDLRQGGWIRAITAVLLLGVATLLVLVMPRGFDTDLGQIGAGKPVLVFVYDPNLVVSNQQTREMDKARETLGEELLFLVADVGRPASRAFMQQHQARSPQLLLFGRDGMPLDRAQAVMSADQLMAWYRRLAEAR